MFKKTLTVLMALSVTACASLNRGCSSWNAESFGADWIIVQYKFDGAPFNCWKLQGVSVTNEKASDGIYWKDSQTGHLVHISGWYNRVQVTARNYKAAADLIGIDEPLCGNGKYPQR